MSEQDQPPQDAGLPHLPEPPAMSPPPPVPARDDSSGWAQPPASQSPGPAGAFVDRPAAPPGPPLPPGAGSPIAPGPPMSVQSPIRDTAINMSALLMMAGAVIVLIILIVVLVSALHPR
jgi:hypothetical protein